MALLLPTSVPYYSSLYVMGGLAHVRPLQEQSKLCVLLQLPVSLVPLIILMCGFS